VRSALQELQRLGLVTSQQGVGSQVRANRLSSRYSHSFSSAEDLLQYATTTSVRILDREEIVVDAALAAKFGCKRGEHWWRMRTVRKDPSTHACIAYSEIHVPLAFGSVLAEAAKSRQPVFALIEQRFNETIYEIRQEITCITRLRNEEAEHLQVPRNAPGMEITRHYIGRNGRVLEVTRSVHPSEMFKYSMSVQLRHGSEA
jgi:DNA-binding GntR family transcriptional regulator